MRRSCVRTIWMLVGVLAGCAGNGPVPRVPPRSGGGGPALAPSALPPSALPMAVPAASVDEAARRYQSHAGLLGSGMSGPNGLARDGAGNLYESDYYRGTVTRVSPTGATSTYAAGFSGPAGLAFDPAGNLFVACYEDHSLRRIPPGGGSQSVFAQAGLKRPVWPAIDRAGRIYLADYDNQRIALVSGAGEVSTFATLPGVNAIALDDRDGLWVTTWGGDVDAVSAGGAVRTVARGLSTACGIAWSPSYMAVVTYGGESGSNGALYLVDAQGHTAQVSDRLDRPSSVLFEPDGTLITANIGDTGLRRYGW